MTKILMVFTIIFFGFLNTRAQELTAELKSVYNTFLESEKFQTNVQVDVFEKIGDELPVETRKFSLKKDGIRSFVDMGQQKVLVNEKGAFIVNEGSRSIYVSEGKDAKKYAQVDMTQGMDSMMQEIDSVEFAGENEGVKSYVLHKNKGLIPRTELDINTKTNSFVLIRYFYNTDMMESYNMVEIRYPGWTSDVTFPEGTFSEQSFVQKSKGNWEGVGPFATFQVVLNEGMK